MYVENVNGIQPRKDMVVVEMVNPSVEVITDQQSDAESVAVRFGKVISKGPEVNEPENCSGLMVGEVALFTQFSGFHIAADKLTKVIRGYDIIATCEDMEDFSIEKVGPSADRLMVEVFKEDEGSDVILGTGVDSRLADLRYGKIIKIGPDVELGEFTVGEIVAYEPYSGTEIRERESDEIPALNILPADLALLKLEK